MPSVYIKTYGCQMNERDSEAVAASFVDRGFSLAPSEAVADVVLLNTCSVRDQAERKALGKMGTLAAEVRRHRPGVLLGFLGCMAQSRGEELLATVPGVRMVLGTQKFHRAAEYAADLLAGRRGPVCDVGEEPGSERAIRDHVLNQPGQTRAVSAFVSIMQGCNQHCTFCIVPTTRGHERSRPIAEIVAECRELVGRGVREVTLLGQIVTSYGRREIGVRDGKSAFVQLLEAVSEVEGLERIRFTSPHPRGYGADLVEAFGRLPKLCENAHLPVQSGSDRMLRAMHRGYTRERYLELVTRLRAVCPELGVSTDLIVGFPGETEDDFEATLGLAQAVRFDSAFVFKYSPRRNTPAATMPGQLPREVIEERHARLLGVINEISGERYLRMQGRMVEVLAEGPSRRNPDRLEGRSRCNKIVVFAGAAPEIGRCVNLRVAWTTATTLYGARPDGGDPASARS
ncbi:MAG: tRNA (N6-isopentenyl adenosine(37)-C2)-methylthiotransferase MiaB [Verrucomicrobiales bacterium]|nr:tRNA (N6-isopentenyl adenosine(37)-C2)-methylthiotransferase MiaB [Verrucomicrobiales bacterium]MCP5526708.1 tRNA (N6-isopentenyl adenosine(37)-C2)-methylthiotransferase MiaB [Verrucomicrobiales bacterium]